MRWTLRTAICILGALLGCATPAGSAEGGLAGEGSSMQFQLDGAEAWGFEVRDGDLVMRFQEGSLVLDGVVPDEGLHYLVHDFELPSIDFGLRDGGLAEWRGADVSFAGESLRFRPN